MNPATHFLTGWVIANMDHLERRDRTLVTLAAVVPDMDGLGIIPDIMYGSQAGPSLFQQFHHVVAHNIFFGLFLVLGGYALSKKKGLSAFFILISFHLHLLGDILSGRGPDGAVWPISYLYPIIKSSWFWPGQWELNAWPNILITAALLGTTLYLVLRKGFSPVSIFSLKADETVVSAIRSRLKRSFLTPISKFLFIRR